MKRWLCHLRPNLRTYVAAHQQTYECLIGLEVHVGLKSASKLFSRFRTLLRYELIF